MELKDKVFSLIKDDIQRGDYGLLQKLVDTVDPRILKKVIPEEMMIDVTTGMNIYVVRTYFNDGGFEEITKLSELVSIMDFNDEVQKGRVNTNTRAIMQYRGVVSGGSEASGWEYYLPHNTPISQFIFNH